jgi:hypothetical protein
MELAERAVIVVVTVHFLPHIFVGDITHFRHIARLVRPSHLPYRSVLWEFPPLTLPFLLLEKVSSGSRAAYLSLFAAVTVSLELASLELLRRAWPDRARELTRIWSATVLPVAALAYFRLDFLAVFFAVLALIGIERRRATAWPIVAGVATKLWPGLLLVVLTVQRRWRTLVAGIVGSVGVFAAWYAFSPSGFVEFVRYRAGRGLEVESLPASVRLLGHHGRFAVRSGAWVIDAGGFRWVDPVVSVGLIAFTAALGWWAYRRRLGDAVALGGALVLATMLFSRLLSAQYIVWLGPFVAVLWIRGRRSVGWLALVSSWLTFVELLWFEHHLIRGSKVMGAVVLARNITLVTLLVVLIRVVADHPEVNRK